MSPTRDPQLRSAHRKACSTRVYIDPWRHEEPTVKSAAPFPGKNLLESPVLSNALASSSRNGAAVLAEADAEDDDLGRKSNHADVLPRISLDASASENAKASGTLQKKSSVSRRLLDDPNSLFWRKSGIIFLPPIRYSTDLATQTGINQERTLKEDTLLCKRTVSACGGADQPVRYKASREARHNALKEGWRQQKVVLTSEYLAIYSSPALSWPEKRLEHQVPLQRAKELKLFLVSPLDYSFCLRYATSSREEYITFTFRARSVIECKMWYLALYKILPSTAKRTCSPWCEVNVPFLGVQVHLPLAEAASGDEGVRYDITLDDVKEATLAVLRKEGGWDGDKHKTLMRSDLDICWRRENRIEWVYWRNSFNNGRRVDLVVGPQHIEQTHRLEILPIEHTPSQIVLHDDTVLKEPPAVEGLLWRLTNFHGKPITSNSRAKRKYYFASFNQFLFYIPRSQASLPDVKNHDDSQWLQVITCFKQDSAELVQKEVDRRMNLLRHASGVIDLTEVSYVRRASEDNEDDEEDMSNEDLAQETSELLRSSQQRYIHGGRARIEIIMQNGLVIKLQAATNEACEEWVHRLAKLVIYWRAHSEAERDAHAQNQYCRTVATEYFVDEKQQHREKTFVDTRIWSYCCYDQCRDIAKTGTMYFQPRSRGTFTKKIFVLTLDGCLLFYNKYDRSVVDCQPIHTAGHDRKGFLEIADCYVFSEHPESIGLADIPRQRIFSDGVATADSSDDCIFTLWKPQSRRIYSPSRKRFTVYKDSKQFFAADGELWLFLAKSKQEKEEWVWAINVVIEHLLRAQGNVTR